MYSGGHMGMAECIFKVQGISRPFLILLYDYSSLDLMIFQDILWPPSPPPLPPWWDAISEPFMTKSVYPTPSPPTTHPNTQTQSQKPQWHKQSMLYFLQLEIQEIHFQNTIHFIILVSTKKAHGEDYKALLEIFLLESLKYTYLIS